MVSHVRAEERMECSKRAGTGSSQLFRCTRITLQTVVHSGVTAKEMVAAFEVQLLAMLKLKMRKHTRSGSARSRASEAITARKAKASDEAAGGDADDDDGGAETSRPNAHGDGAEEQEVGGGDDDDDGAKGEGRKKQNENQYEEPDTEDLATLRHGRSVEAAEDNDEDEGEEEEEAEELGSIVDDAKAGVLNQHLVDFGHRLDGTALELWVACELPLSAPRMLYVPLFEEMAKAICVKSTPCAGRSRSVTYRCIPLHTVTYRYIPSSPHRTLAILDRVTCGLQL